MTNLHGQEQTVVTAGAPTPCEYEATLNDLCFGWAVESNLVYAARFLQHMKQGPG